MLGEVPENRYLLLLNLQREFKLDLFSDIVDPKLNLLPKDGIVNYYGIIFTNDEANFYLENLLTQIEWRFDEAIIYGKRIVTKRKVAWYGDKDYPYTYSNTTKIALTWTKELLELKGKIENLTEDTFNSCLLNLYHNGGEGMAWHSDDEKALAKNGSIASLSFGAERKFCFKHKRIHDKVCIKLDHGSLLVMKGETQTHWLHRLPPTKLILKPRVNLTFRTII